MAEIVIENLSFKYPLSGKNALDDINLRVKESDFVVVIGKSGCGKTTLLRHIKKNLVPYGESEGHVFYGDVNISDIEDRVSASSIGYVGQNPDNQLVTDKVWHELAFGLENLGYSSEVIRRRVAEIASYFGTQGWFRMDVSELSGGQKQLLNLASVMVMQPEVLILDEPASQLDPIAASDFLNTVHRINREIGTTVIISEHRLEEVFPMASKVVVLDEGKMILEGRPEKVALDLSAFRDGSPHAMYFGMPGVMRAFPTEKLKDESLPLTIRDGRLLLSRLLCEKKHEEKKETGLKSEYQNAGNSEKTGNGEFAIEIKHCYFRYEKSGDDILRDLNLEVNKGEIFCILGGNGTGKTTCLKAVSGIVKPYRGRIDFGNKGRTALVPQNPQALFTEISCEEEIFEALSFSELKDEERIRITEDTLKLMEIDHLRKRNPMDISGGEQERLAIGKVLALKPDILLLDEPTKGLDPFFKRTLGGILKKLRDEGTTVILVSHDIEFCAEYGDQCALFFDGSIISTGKSKDFFVGNSFYTTPVNRMTKEWKGDLVTPEEAKEWLTEVL